MSGDGNSGGEGGYDLNAFVDWGGMYNVLGASGSGSSPGTQGSSTPAYQTPSFPIDAYYRPSAPRYGQTQGLSQIRENIPEEHTPENLPTGARRGGGGGGRGGGSSASRGSGNEEEEEEDEAVEDVGRHPYSSAETMALFDAWINTSYDPIVGNQQSRKCFWDKVTAVYNEQKPKGTFRRNTKMLRGHFDRSDKDIKKFCGIYKHEAENYQSGASGADILRAAMRVFKSDTGKDFKFADVWQSVKDHDRWAGGVQSSIGSSSKRTKHTAGGQYSSSEGGEGNASQEVDEFPTSDAGGSSGTRRRPQGNKTAKAARARAGRGRGESSQAGSQGGPPHSLMSMYFTATMADTSRMTPAQYQAHHAGIEYLASQLGIPPPSSLGAPPPPSGDDSPAE